MRVGRRINLGGDGETPIKLQRFDGALAPNSVPRVDEASTPEKSGRPRSAGRRGGLKNTPQRQAAEARRRLRVAEADRRGISTAFGAPPPPPISPDAAMLTRDMNKARAAFGAAPPPPPPADAERAFAGMVSPTRESEIEDGARPKTSRRGPHPSPENYHDYVVPSAHQDTAEGAHPRVLSMMMGGMEFEDALRQVEHEDSIGDGDDGSSSSIGDASHSTLDGYQELLGAVQARPERVGVAGPAGRAAGTHPHDVGVVLGQGDMSPETSSSGDASEDMYVGGGYVDVDYDDYDDDAAAGGPDYHDGAGDDEEDDDDDEGFSDEDDVAELMARTRALERQHEAMAAEMNAPYDYDAVGDDGYAEAYRAAMEAEDRGQADDEEQAELRRWSVGQRGRELLRLALSL